ncbi:hypothetical protein [Shewanella algae]|uniref:Uncharacterized protein n=1 Tax=Shewanella algae TaxID=38313 RepID=A0AAD1K8M2_9GAMM|nr:hypothetical protein [Shewanella algae]BCV44443.1 hypothetical protein TUM17379_14610 [Shewanella algae]
MNFDNIIDYSKKVNENQVVKNDLLFSSKEFNCFNSDKCDLLYVHQTSKVSMIFGVRDNKLIAPFSAPFSFIRYGSNDLKLRHLDDFYQTLISDVNLEPRIDTVSITLPPYFYDQSMITKNSIALFNAGFEIAYRDINSHIDIRSHCFNTLGSSSKKGYKS